MSALAAPPSIVLTKPVCRLSDADRRLLDTSITENVMKLPKTVLPGERIAISDRVATACAAALLAPLRVAYEVTDMNRIRIGFHGYDFLVHRRGTIATRDPSRNRGLRIQVKGNTSPDWIGFDHGSEASVQYDACLVVDIGANTTARPKHPRGRSPHSDLSTIPIKDEIGFYCLPVEVVRARIAESRKIAASLGRVYKRPYVSYWRIPTDRPSEAPYSWPDFLEWEDRFDVITGLLHLADQPF